MRKRTNEEYIRLVSEVHNGKYDYSRTQYVNKRTKICIVCPIHGEFWQCAHNHLRGQGCPECGKEYARTWTKNQYENFVNESEHRFCGAYSFPNIKDEYENSHSKVTIKCNKCGNVFEKVACYHLSSPFGGCKCHITKKCYSFDDLSYFVKGKNINIIPFSGTISGDDTVKCLCEKHGEYTINVKTILQGRGLCKKCAGGKKSLSADDIKNKLNKLWGDAVKFDLTGYKTHSSKIKFTCLKCGHEFVRKVQPMLTKDIFANACPNCSKVNQIENRLKTTEQFIEDAIKVYGDDKYDFSETKYIASDKKVLIKCNECGRSFEIESNSFLQGHGCPYHNRNSSRMEKELGEILKSNGINVATNDRMVLEGYELDILLPDYNIAIEFDGLYWHNELNKTKNYHIEKTEKCLQKGIRLIHIFEDEWIENKELWISMILNMLQKSKEKIYARKCEVREIENKECNDFLAKNHIQGKCPSTIKIGLYYNQELVSVMTFGKSRHFIGSGKYQYELLRFCNKQNLNVVGGAGKLLSYFEKKYKPKSIVSYADRRWSVGNLYTKLGFVHTHNSSPNYFYVVGNKRKNRFNFRKSVLVSKYGCDENVSEKEFCMSKKWYRIYDCGTMVFVKKYLEEK